MVFCAAYQCKSSSNKKEPDITFHRFPANPVKKNLWVQAVKLENWTPSPNDRLCSKHFEKRFFYQTDFKRCLLHSAVPTIFPELPNYMQPKKTVKRKALHLEAVPGTSGSHGTQALIVDEISLRQQVEWDGKKYYGYVNFGVDLDIDLTEVAKEAFVLMVVDVNTSWKLPVGYFFANSLRRSQKCSIVSQCIQLIDETGA